MEVNKFELTGKVGYVDVKYNQNGLCITRTSIVKKAKKEGEYDTFFLNFFGEEAEKYGENVKKGDVVNIIGVIALNKFEKEGKSIERIELYGNSFKKARFDENQRKYVEDEQMPWK